MREFCRIGHRVILQNGVVVGGDGFGFAKRADGTHYKIVQSGVTVIEDDVEIQSLSSIDRATVGETPRQARRQNRQPGAGGPRLRGRRGQHHLRPDRPRRQHRAGENVLLAGQVGVSGHLTIHDDAIVYAQSGIGGDVAKGGAHLRLAGVRRARMAARHHRFPQTARTAEDRARTQEEARSNSKQTCPKTDERQPNQSRPRRWPIRTRSF